MENYHIKLFTKYINIYLFYIKEIRVLHLDTTNVRQLYSLNISLRYMDNYVYVYNINIY